MRRQLMTMAMVTTLIGALALVPAAARAAPASVNHATYQFVIGVAPLPPQFQGLDVAIAPNGTTVSMLGQGSFTAGPSSAVSGNGTYTITNSSGATVKGAWSAMQMLSFVNYGSGAVKGYPPTPLAVRR